MPSSERPMTILLAEDDDGDAKALQRSFLKDQAAPHVVRAVDGIETLEMLKGLNGRARVPSPRIVIADLNMPRMNGIQLLKAIREDANKDVRNSVVFILSTSNREEDKSAAYEHKAAGYIVKAKAAQDFSQLVKLVDIYRSLVDLP